ncbi:MAG: sporulation protein YabP [Clostridia bacterium]|nr:sporulation protein YabP [Clostridia bacterium]
MEDKFKAAIDHNIILEGRKVLRMSGVKDVDSFDEQTVVTFTNMGELTIRGENIHVSKLNTETGELSLEGEFYALYYSDSTKQNGGFFSKIFR